MLSTPHRFVDPADVIPGASIEHEHVPMHVDEVRRTADGWTFYARPPHRPTSGKRSTIEVKAGDKVKLLPSDVERAALMDHLFAQHERNGAGSILLSVNLVTWIVGPALEWVDAWPGPLDPDDYATVTLGDDEIDTELVEVEDE